MTHVPVSLPPWGVRVPNAGMPRGRRLPCPVVGWVLMITGACGMGPARVILPICG